MADTPRELRALAAIVASLRPTWPLPVIESALAKDPRNLAALTVAAVTAAENPNTRHPNGILTEFPNSADCAVCRQREQAAALQPPKPARCERCNALLSDTGACLGPACRLSVKPEWFDRHKSIVADFVSKIALAKAQDDWVQVGELREALQVALKESA